MAYLEMGEFQKAHDKLSEAIRLQPNFADAYVNRAKVFLEVKDYQRAVQECTNAIHEETRTYNAYLYRGLALEKLEQYPEAIKSLQSYLEYAPDTDKYISLAKAKITELSQK